MNAKLRKYRRAARGRGRLVIDHRRSEVVDTLRIAADYCGIVQEAEGFEGYKLWWGALSRAGCEGDAELFDLCIEAERSVLPPPTPQRDHEHRIYVLLEAAIRVETNEWP